MAHQNHDFFNEPHEYKDGTYVKKEYAHQEYPKNVNGVIVNNAEEEAALPPKEAKTEVVAAEASTEVKTD